MKFKKSLLTPLMLAGLLSITGCAHHQPEKQSASGASAPASTPKSNLDDATRANQNILLDPSYYNSDHLLPGSM